MKIVLLYLLAFLSLGTLALYDRMWGNLTLFERKQRWGKTSLFEKLNGWQRIGVVISGLWIIGFSVASFVLIVQEMVTRTKAVTFIDVAGIAAFLLGGSLIPVIAFWVVAFVVVRVVRWVVSGFREQD